jgi:Carboxypeptidase regulatory-like domain
MQLFACNVTVLGLTAFHTVTTPRLWRRAWKWATSLRRPPALGCSPLLLCLITTGAYAQQQISELRIISSSLLPDAPLPQSDPQSSTEQTASAEGAAAVSGVVLDGSGAAVPGAQVSLTHRDGTQLRSLVSGGRGEFAFTKLPAGYYLVTISAKGFAVFTSGEFTLSPQQSYEVPSISLSVASANSEVTVRPTEMIAAEQIKAEEKQRLLGIAPNFYVSYVKDAAPLTTKQKFSLATHDTLDWTSWIGISFSAGIEQANTAMPVTGKVLRDMASVGPQGLAMGVQVTTSAMPYSPHSFIRIHDTSTREPDRISRVCIMQ